jgi:hypothetical protein
MIKFKIMNKYSFRHKQETWLIITIAAYDYELAVINIEKCKIDIQDYDFIGVDKA